MEYQGKKQLNQFEESQAPPQEGQGPGGGDLGMFQPLCAFDVVPDFVHSNRYRSLQAERDSEGEDEETEDDPWQEDDPWAQSARLRSPPRRLPGCQP